MQTPENAQVANAIVTSAQGAGYRVAVLPGANGAAQDWFVKDSQLDALILPTWDSSSREATALVYFRGSPNPRSVRHVGTVASRETGSKVVEILSSSALMLGPVVAPTNETEGNARDPAAVRNEVLTALGLMSESKYTEALVFLERAIAVEPNDTQILYNLALCNQKLGKELQARTYIDRAYRLDGHHAGINILLGNEALARGQLPDAVAHYEIARQSPATASVANWNLAVVYNRMGRPEKVRAHLMAVSDTSVQQFDAQRWLALIDTKVNAVRLASEARTRWLARAGLIAFGGVAVMLGFGMWRLLKQTRLPRKELALQLIPTFVSAILAALSAVLPQLLGNIG